MKKLLCAALAACLVMSALTGCGEEPAEYTPLGAEEEMTGNWIWSENPEVQITFTGNQFFEMESGGHLWDGEYTFDGSSMTANIINGMEDPTSFTASVSDGLMTLDGYNGTFSCRGAKGLRSEEYSFILNTWTDPVNDDSFTFNEEDVEAVIDGWSQRGDYYFNGTDLILDFAEFDYTGYFDEDGDLILDGKEGIWFSAPGNTIKMDALEAKKAELLDQSVGLWRNETAGRDLELYENGDAQMYSNEFSEDDGVSFSVGTYTYDGETLNVEFYDPLKGSFNEDGTLVIEDMEGSFTRLTKELTPPSAE